MLKKLILCVFLIFYPFLHSQELINSSTINLSFDVIEDIKLFHSPPNPLFIGRPFELTLVTEIDESLLTSVLLFFKTNKMKSYREITLSGDSGLYKYKIDINDFPSKSIEYFFAIRTIDGRIYGAPVDDNKSLSPIRRILIDPVQYFEQKKRLNQ
tara:strand:+ start:150 stop:614 length:465 start_codon:yes stop_codon:yes gene_type:complete